MRSLLFIFSIFCSPAFLFARPLLTEEVAPLTRATFDASMSVSYRTDEFGSPRTDYRTVQLPVRLRMGIFKQWDLGLTFSHLSQTLKTGSTELTGSRPGLLSPEIKFSISENVGFLTVWHMRRAERTGQQLPIARGDDIEFWGLFKLPFSWNTTFNIGYLLRDNYNSKFGVEGVRASRVRPSDIFQARASVEIPLRFHFSLLGETAFYSVGKKKIGASTISGSDGEALDALLGLTWAHNGWNIGTGIAFGLLDESHTSFDLERGAGDVTGKFTVAYKLKAKKPNS